MSAVKAIRLAVFATLVSFLGGTVASAQAPAFDNSGNALLKGTFYFREVIYILSDQAGNFGRALSIYGNINFDGAGNYTLTGTNVFDSDTGFPQALTSTGVYTISSSGFGFITSPIAQNSTIYGSVANGIF